MTNNINGLKDPSTRATIRELSHVQGMSGRAIATLLNLPPRTVQAYLSGSSWFGEGKLEGKTKDVSCDSTGKANLMGSPVKCKLLFLDIETKYMLLEGHQLFNMNFSVDQIAEDWSILSYSAKWLHSDEVIYSDVSEKTEDDILEELWLLLDEADFVVAHNGRRFDLKKIRARLVTRGFKPYRPLRVIDTFEIAKTEFGFTSNKLLYLTRLLCKKNKKSDHGKFAGHILWKEFVKGNPEAIQEMRHYNMMDVTSLEELFFILAPWSSKLPNFDVFYAEADDHSPSAWVHDGYTYTNLGKYELYRNILTGSFRRGRINLLSKEEKKKLLANI